MQKYQYANTLVYNQLKDSEKSVWSLLVASGYLKIVSHSRPEAFKSKSAVYEVKITNYEVEIMFQDLVAEWFEDAEVYYDDFICAFMKGDLKMMNSTMKDIVFQTFSCFDTGKGRLGNEPERFYHGFILGMIIRFRDKFIITSNRESGFGRYDVMLEPRNKKDDAYILEFKVYDRDDEEGLQETLEAALNQIEEKQYETTLIVKGVNPEKIHKYGFAFRGKEVLIGGR